MATTREAVIEVAGREVAITNPDKLFFPRGRPHQARPGPLLRGGRRGRAARHRGAADRAQALRRRRRRASRSSRSARPSSAPSGSRRWSSRFPSGRTAREIVVRDAAQLLWIVNLGCIDLNPHPVRADDLEHPDELRVDLDPGPGVSWDDVRRVALLVRDVLDEHGLRGWPKTSGSRGMHVNVRIAAALDASTRCGAPRWPLAREVERRAPELATQQVVEGGAPRRLPRLQPERQGPHGGLGLVGAADARRARVDAARVGRGGRLRSGGVHARHRAGALRRARRRRGGHRRARRDRSTACSSSSARRRPRASATRRGRRTTASRTDEPPRVAPSRRSARAASTARRGRRQSTQPLITVAKAAHKEEALAGLERWKARHPEAAAQLARRRRPRRLDARPLDHLDAHPRQPAPRPRRRAPGRGAARSRLRSLARRRVAGPPTRRARRRRAPARRRASPRADRSGSRCGRLSGRQRRNCAAWRKRVPCMWS